jgi:PAS domain-containing protein
MGQRVWNLGDEYFGVICSICYTAPTLFFKGGWSYGVQVEDSRRLETQPIEFSLKESELSLIAGDECNELLLSSSNKVFLPHGWPRPKFGFNSKVWCENGESILEGIIQGLEFYQGQWAYLFVPQKAFDEDCNPRNLTLDDEAQIVAESELQYIDKHDYEIASYRNKTATSPPTTSFRDGNLMFELSQADTELVTRVHREHPDAAIWIVSMVSQKPLYMNWIARQQTCRTASQLMDDNVISFWDYSDLERLMERLPIEREVKNYEGEGWIFAQEIGLSWPRVRCQYLTDYYILGDCLGEPARLSVVKQATPFS